MAEETDFENQAFLYSQYRRLDQLSTQYEESDDEETDDDEDEELLDSIISVSDNILKILPQDTSAIQCKTFALLENEDYEEVVEATTSFAGSGVVTFERAYALYKLKRERDALQELRSIDIAKISFEMLQLKAQVYYKLGQYSLSATTYEQVFVMVDAEEKKEEDDREFEVDDNDRMELCTNMAAAYVNSNHPTRGLKSIDTRFPNTKEYELLFNRACALIACDSFGQARETLAQAEVVAKSSMEQEGHTKEEITQKCMVIQASRAVVDQLCGDEDNARRSYEAVIKILPKEKNSAAVAQNNIVSLRGDEHELFDSSKRLRALEKVQNLTARQQHVIGLNALSLRVLTGKIDEARKTISQFRQDMAISQETKEGGTQGGVQQNASSSNGNMTEEDVILVEAGMLFRLKKIQECDKMLKDALLKYPDMRRLVVARAHLAVRTGDVVGAAAMLQGSAALGSTPAGIAAQVRLFERAGRDDDASRVLQAALKSKATTDKKDKKFTATLLSASAEMHMRREDYSTAAATYQEIVYETTDADALVAARANLVVACSYFDPERAAKEASKLPGPTASAFTAEELEESLAPQNTYKRASINRGRRKDSDASPAVDTVSSRKQKDQQAKEVQKAMLTSRKKRILRRRRKRAATFLEELRLRPDNLNKTELPAPDPERWVPKRLRRARRRNRGRRGREKQMQGGHQGGVVSQDDLNKYDAAAKAQRDKEAAVAESETKTKASGGKKKKGKKKKKGRR